MIEENLSILNDITEFQNIPSSKTTEFTHSIHPYPAKFIPQIPNRIIKEFSNERHTILDPFSGSGTTLLEAKMLGRNSVGFDINPIGVLTSRVKTHSYTKEELRKLDDWLESILSRNNETKYKGLWKPEIPRIEHWFQKDAINALSVIVDEIRKIENIDIRRFFNLCLSGIIVSVSNQESETRFASKPKEITFDKVFKNFERKALQTKRKILETLDKDKFSRSKCEVHLSDSRNICKVLDDSSIDLVITSPPYINSFDYYLYHKFRIFWLSYPENDEVIEVSEVQKKELGSRYKYSGKNALSVNTFKSEMIECFSSVHKVTKPGKMVFIVIGDSIVQGEFMEMDKFYRRVCEEAGMKYVGQTSYKMKGASRSFISQNKNNKHFNRKQTHVLVFQNGSKKNSLNGGTSQSLASEASDYKEVKEIPLNISNGQKISIQSDRVTDYTHGIIKYPAKFIPHIPRWAIEKYTTKGDLVMDNFMGSGTTNLEAILLERSSIGLDINPIAVLTAKVKTNPISPDVLSKSFSELLFSIKKVRLGKSDVIEFPLQEFWFDKNELKTIFKIKKGIMGLKDESIRDFFQICLYSVIKKVSYLDESQLKVKRDHKKLLNGVKDTLTTFINQSEKNIRAMESYWNYLISNKTTPWSICKLLKSQEILHEYVGKIDLVVSSPPYINAMNYPMFHRYELLLSGLITPNNYIEHQQDYIGTERVYAAQYNKLSFFKMKGNQFKELNDKISKVFEKEKKRAYIVTAYFEEMKNTIEAVYDYLKPGGVYVIVCGTNQIKGEFIDTCDLLGQIGVEVGFKRELEFSYQIRKHRFKITRHKTGKKINEDKIVVLRK